MDMAGRTGADTAAIAVAARYIIEERRLACGFALGNFDFPPRSIAGYERHFDHHTLRISASANQRRSEEHTSELQSLMRISYAVFCLQKKTITTNIINITTTNTKRDSSTIQK